MELDSVTGGRGRNARSPFLLRTHCTAKLRSHWYRSVTVRSESADFQTGSASHLLFFSAPLRWKAHFLTRFLFICLSFTIFISHHAVNLFCICWCRLSTSPHFFLPSFHSLSYFPPFLFQFHLLPGCSRCPQSCIKLDEI